MPGINKCVDGGFLFQYDFIPDVALRKSSRLNADYFINHNNQLQISQATTHTLLGTDEMFITNSNNNFSNITTSQKFNTSYVKEEGKHYLGINLNSGINYSKSVNTNISEQEQTGTGIISNSSSDNEDKNTSKNISLKTEYRHTDDIWSAYEGPNRHIPNNFSVSYTFGVTGNNGNGRTQSLFNSAVEPSANSEYDRLYNRKDGTLMEHSFYFNYPGIKEFIFGRYSLGGIKMGITGNVIIDNNTYQNQVSDWDTLSRKYTENTWLSNNRNEHTLNILPQFDITKIFSKNLTNRYYKYLDINFNLQMQDYSFSHSATQSIQNIHYRYAYFTPKLSFSYYNHQYGNYEIRNDLNFSANVNYPNINQLAPLADSSNLWYIPQGNRALQPEYQKTFGLSGSLTGRKPKNPYEINWRADYGITEHKMTDSSFYDSAGRKFNYIVNINNYRYWHIGNGYRKSYSSNQNNTFVFGWQYNFYYYHSPQYVNNVLNVTTSYNHNVNLDLSYAYKDIVNVKIEQGFNFYNSLQNDVNTIRWETDNRFTRFSGALQLPKNLTWSTNLTYNRNSSTNQQAVNYTIWNASLTYRFLKGKKGEIKFSSLDLLHQNKSITNTSSSNEMTFGHTNILQQYFMLTLAYYPRKFGK
jgi:hypothetical protein